MNNTEQVERHDGELCADTARAGALSDKGSVRGGGLGLLLVEAGCLLECTSLCFAEPRFLLDRSVIWPVLLSALAACVAGVIAVLGRRFVQRRTVRKHAGQVSDAAGAMFFGAQCVVGLLTSLLCAQQIFRELAILGLTWQRILALVGAIIWPLFVIVWPLMRGVGLFGRGLWSLWGLALTLFGASLPRMGFKAVMKGDASSIDQGLLWATLLVGSMVWGAFFWKLALKKMRWGAALLLGSFFLLCLETSPAMGERSAEAPKTEGDVIVILFDALRPDYCSWGIDRAQAGGRRDEAGERSVQAGSALVPLRWTPAMEKLARGGARFTAAFSPSNATAYAMPLLLNQKGSQSDAPGPSFLRDLTWLTSDDARFEASLPGQMAKRGYALVNISDFPDKSLPGFDKARWDFVTPSPSPFFVIQKPVKVWRSIWSHLPSSYAHAGLQGPARLLSEQLSRFDRPLFAFIHLGVPHLPYDLPPYRVQSLPEWPLSEAMQLFESIRLQNALPGREPFYKKGYARAVRAADEQLQQLLLALERAGRLDKAKLILLSDHGEPLGERHRLGHGLMLYDEAVRTPLVLKGPDVQPRQVIDEPVSTRALMQMIIDWADGLDPIASIMRQSARHENGETGFIVEHPNGLLYVTKRDRLIWTKSRLALTNDDVWVHRLPFELYDVEHDQAELYNLLTPHQAHPDEVYDRFLKLTDELLYHPDLSPEDAALLKKSRPSKEMLFGKR